MEVDAFRKHGHPLRPFWFVEIAFRHLEETIKHTLRSQEPSERTKTILPCTAHNAKQDLRNDVDARQCSSDSISTIIQRVYKQHSKSRKDEYRKTPYMYICERDSLNLAGIDYQLRPLSWPHESFLHMSLPFPLPHLFLSSVLLVTVLRAPGSSLTTHPSPSVTPC